MSILTEDIKNTRFLLTLIAVGTLLVVGIGVFVMIALQVTVSEAMMTIITTIVGALIGLVGVAYNSYFKDRQTAESESKENEKAIALAEANSKVT